MASFVTLDQYAAITGQTAGIGESVEFALEAVCAEIRTLLSQTLTLVEDDVIVLDGTGNGFLLLPQVPVVEVSDVTINAGLDSELVLDPAEYVVKNLDGMLYRGRWKCWPWGVGNVTVTYTHGYAEIPMDIVNVAVQAARAGLLAPVEDSTLLSETIAGYSYTRSSSAQVIANAVATFGHILDRYAVKRIPVP